MNATIALRVIGANALGFGFYLYKSHNIPLSILLSHVIGVACSANFNDVPSALTTGSFGHMAGTALGMMLSPFFASTVQAQAVGSMMVGVTATALSFYLDCTRSHEERAPGQADEGRAPRVTGAAAA